MAREAIVPMKTDLGTVTAFAVESLDDNFVMESCEDDLDAEYLKGFVSNIISGVFLESLEDTAEGWSTGLAWTGEVDLKLFFGDVALEIELGEGWVL